MVSPFFTGLALISSGRVVVAPAPAQPIPVPEIRGYLRDADDDVAADKGLKRR